MKILLEDIIPVIHMKAGDTITVSYEDDKICSCAITEDKMINKIVISEHEELYGMTAVLSVSMGKSNGS